MGDGHFTSVLEDLKAEGKTVGHLVEYFARKENRRADVLQEISKYHSNCNLL